MVFVPWNYVFTDAAVTGVVNNRIGYGLAKASIELDGEGAVEVLYVDELSRASRDGLEALMLGRLVQNKGKRIVGVSDGFDSHEEFSRMKLHILAMFNEEFVNQHRHGVRRGRDGARRRGGVIGKLPLGIKAVEVLGSDGLPIRGRQGTARSAEGWA